MATNDYDKYAEQRAKEFAAGTNLVHAYIEKPAMYELLPNLEGKNVLCIGCGTGEECAELQSRGANVTGIDVSADSISYASSHAPGALFQTLDMDNVPALKKLGSFDLIYSSLTLHYSNDLKTLLSGIYSLLNFQGQLLFSVGHPLRWASDITVDNNTKTILMGYRQNNEELQVFGDYLSTKQFTQKLSDGPEVTYWMRPVSAYFELLKETGFSVKEFKEPIPLAEVQEIDKNFWNLRTKMPVDMIFLAERV